MKRTILFAVFALVLMPMVAGCQTTVEDAKTDFCEKLQAFGTAVDGLGQITGDSTMEELDTARANVDTAWTDLQAASETLEEVQLDDTKGAVEELMSAVDGVSDDATLNQAAGGLAAAAQATRVQIEAIGTTVCVSVPAYGE